MVDVPADHPRSVEWIVAEAEAASSRIHRGPLRRVRPAARAGPAAAALAQRCRRAVSSGPADVLLVTGGGKGIAAECALALAARRGCAWPCSGGRGPSRRPDLAANLERMAAAGVEFHYIAADVTDADAVRAAVQAAESALGPITAVVHGAGVNVPRLLGSLDEAAFLRTLAPKVEGLRNMLAAVEADRLKLLVTFGSIIARTGMPGEADYALANEWLTRLTERFQREHPACRCLALEWSVWSGVGMGDRLGRVDALARQGITPIPPDEGVALFRRLVAVRCPRSVVSPAASASPRRCRSRGASSRCSASSNSPGSIIPGSSWWSTRRSRPRRTPTSTTTSSEGERLFPAVMGLEAMAQAAMAVLRVAEPPVFEDVRFDRPSWCPPGGRRRSAWPPW